MLNTAAKGRRVKKEEAVRSMFILYSCTPKLLYAFLDSSPRAVDLYSYHNYSVYWFDGGEYAQRSRLASSFSNCTFLRAGAPVCISSL